MIYVNRYRYFFLVCCVWQQFMAGGQPAYFKTITETKALKNNRQSSITPISYRTICLDTSKLHSLLRSAPSGKNLSIKLTAPVIGLSMPDNTTAYFRIWESSVMASGLAARFPELKTYTGQSVANPGATAKNWIGQKPVFMPCLLTQPDRSFL